jgi:DNA-binding CsgD family transcriptional regulator
MFLHANCKNIEKLVALMLILRLFLLRIDNHKCTGGCAMLTDQATAVVSPAHFGQTEIPPIVVAAATHARQELVIVLPGRTASAARRHLGSALARVGADGVRIRVLVTLPAVPRDTGRIGLRSAPAAEVRLAPAPVPELAIIDGRTAFVGTEAIPTSDTAVIRSLYALFNSLWTVSSSGSGPVRPVLDVDGEIIAHLADGCTDEVAARRLGVSVRTYRRHVARIMEDVGAVTRFQAGVLASERGLV